MERPLQPGESFAGFVVREVLREGGMSRVYRVGQPGESDAWVMKVPRLGVGNHSACYLGFETEMMVLSRLSGPHVPRFVASGEDGEAPWLVMEEIAGPSLSDTVRRAPLPAEEIAPLAARVAAAIHELHRQDVIHLDIKPANVRFRPGGEAVLLDFGLARHSRLPDLAGEESDRPMGTGAYIAPEQVLGVRDEPRSDIFALGAILYALATGELPFGNPETPRGLRRRLYEDPVPPRARVDSIPPWYQEIVLRCLEPEPRDRYATAAQVAYDLLHPDQVAVGERGYRTRRSGPGTRLRRWWRAARAPRGGFQPPSDHIAGAPHVLVALDTGASEAIQQALRHALARIVAARDDCLVTCVTVFEPSELNQGDGGEDMAHGMITEQLMALRHWAQPLRVDESRLRFHVLRGTDPAARITDYAAAHHVDHILMGARGSGSLRRFLGSVSARVAAQAPCTVTVVRAAEDREAREAPTGLVL